MRSFGQLSVIGPHIACIPAEGKKGMPRDDPSAIWEKLGTIWHSPTLASRMGYIFNGMSLKNFGLMLGEVGPAAHFMAEFSAIDDLEVTRKRVSEFKVIHSLTRLMHHNAVLFDILIEKKCQLALAAQRMRVLPKILHAELVTAGNRMAGGALAVEDANWLFIREVLAASFPNNPYASNVSKEFSNAWYTGQHPSYLYKL